MVKLKEYLDCEITRSIQTPKPSSNQWILACQALMVRILLFNKRRVAEVQELKVKDILDAESAKDNQDIMSQMDITEKTLAKRMRVVEVRGKSTRGLRKVFVILSEPMMKACNHLIQTRLYAGIDPSNEFLFARPGGSVLDGCKAMRDVTTKCPGLECPQLIRTRLLRKYLATTIQLLDMNGEELKMVADHMGHSLTIHTDVYRLQTTVLEKTKVARALIAMENGQLGKFAGRNLSACSIDELPIPVVEEEDDTPNDVIQAAIETESVTEEIASDATTSINREDVTKKTVVHDTLNSKKRKKNDDDEVVPPKQKKPNTRKRWNPQEEASIQKEFQSHIASKQNPTHIEIIAAQEKYQWLKNRSVAVIKSKINNIILGKCKRSLDKTK